jgi:ribosomal protein S14
VGSNPSPFWWVAEWSIAGDCKFFIPTRRFESYPAKGAVSLTVELFVYTKNCVGSNPTPPFFVTKLCWFKPDPFFMKLFSRKTDVINRKHFKNKEFALLLRKVLIGNAGIDSFYKKTKLTFACRPRINNRCILTGRTHAVYKGFKVSRHVLKGMGSLGYLPGIRKCS